MIVMKAAGKRILALGILAAGAGLGLAACGSIDEMLFGGGTEQAAQPPATAPAAPEGGAPGTTAPQAAPAAAPETPAPASATLVPPPAAVTTTEAAPASAGGEFTTVPVQPGGETGTTVSHTIESLRTQLQGIETKLAGDAQHFADLKNSATQTSTAYQDATAHIATHLGAGTTRGNPQLINEWNTAQGALNSLTSNINALSALATEVSGNSSTAHQELDTIQATFNISGAVDEDHRQLAVLSDETRQTIVVLDRLRSEAIRAVQRQTAYVANERGNLTRLAGAIKAGEYTSLATSTPAARASREAALVPGEPIVTIKFDRAHVSYDRMLYSALSRTLAAMPSASFNVVGVSPAPGPAASVQPAQDSAAQNAQAVMHSMSEMGVPATRMAVSSSTDPSISSSEVRVYVR